MQQFPLLDSFTLNPTQRAYLITDHEQNDNLDVLFSKAEAFTEINIRVILRKSGIKYYHGAGSRVNNMAFWQTKDRMPVLVDGLTYWIIKKYTNHENYTHKGL